MKRLRVVSRALDVGDAFGLNAPAKVVFVTKGYKTVGAIGVSEGVELRAQSEFPVLHQGCLEAWHQIRLSSNL